ncbi:MAG: ShlB/FhaC/HecB family hemolysin secretion/activation protein [Pseudanabaena sp. M135S2SP2A07QC]|nr:ShlB/FhaC/HecB family hemolysin secretion/activation protein [Pseudanabaena sp. M090S1SP2A07QC]MCA6506756.1 ShlB/FhaC/HecB family hemolysin secretion/activation protein [Pseudanabaena sp. M172S2SP2A07QC]MCA6518234.1 ShlB/FhaC/HecB family hemolysin secretion/activation protein [Pseudanabaena sp. M110S1SP2A07QC]MCA6521365.1 ShlB/FhaC/HecB family hemolysin secretion/activation protein [Pseudanabaena sp. M051S1SP2A07QC]MCA6525403.1 ShlB/FhaC/HecB family hemolysin secretion/activation protein [Ps
MKLFKLVSYYLSSSLIFSYLLIVSIESAAALPVNKPTNTNSTTSHKVNNSSLPLTEPSPVVSSPIAQAIAVKKIEIIGSTILTSAEIAAIAKTVEGQQVTPEQIEKTAQSVTQIYADRGYITSQAVVDTEKTANGIVTIKVIEGRIEKIEIVGLKNTNPDYVRSRLELGTGTPLNTAKLEDQLRLLRADPIFSDIEASLKSGSQPDSSILAVTVKEANQFGGFASIDNFSPPAVGSERYGGGLFFRNLSGNGDTLAASYYGTTTGGSNQYDLSYNIPLNPMNGTLSLRYSPSNYRITQDPFDVLNIRGNSNLFDLNFRQPLVRSSVEEFALSIGYSYQNGQTFAFNNLATPFGIGPEPDGTTRTSVIKFGQDYTLRDLAGAWSLRSQFSIGTGLFGSTNVTTPSGSFLSWLGQIQRVQSLGTDSLLIGALDLQLSADPLLSSQQFTIGVGQSLRGFRQNASTGDNGIRFSLENRFVALRNDLGATLLQVIPFLDTGAIWNHPNNPNTLPSQNFLAGGGLGLLFTPLERLNMRLDYAVPFVNLSDRGSNLQESAFYFSLGYQF